MERWFLDLAEGLRARGHAVAAAGRPGGPWVRRCAEAGFATCELPLRSDFGPSQTRRLARFLRAHRVDVIATKLHRGIRTAGFASIFAGRPAVVAFMGLVETRPGLRYRWTYRHLLDRVVTLSEPMRREIAEIGGIDPAKVEIVPQGIRVGAFDVPAGTRERVRAALDVAEDAPVAVAIGRMQPQKRFDRLLDAWAVVVRELPRARLWIVGEGPLSGTVERRRAELGLGGSVALLGFRRDVADVFAGADCLAMSSDDEGIPVVAMEAMAAGRPVVSTDVGSIAAAVEDGRTGLLVPREEVAGLAAALVRVLGDPAAARAMGAAGRAKAVERFGIDRCVEDTERLFLSLTRRPSSAGPGR